MRRPQDLVVGRIDLCNAIGGVTGDEDAGVARSDVRDSAYTHLRDDVPGSGVYPGNT